LRNKYLVFSVWGWRESTIIITCFPSPTSIIPVYSRILPKKLSRAILDWIYIYYLSAVPYDSAEMMLLNRVKGISDMNKIKEIIRGRLGGRLLYMYEVDCLPGR